MSKTSKGAKPAPTKEADRRNGKAAKKHPRTGREGATGRTVGGYSPARLEIRAHLRSTPRLAPSGDANVD